MVVGVAGAEVRFVVGLPVAALSGEVLPGAFTWLVRCDCGVMSAASPRLLSPALVEQPGQAPGPCASSTFSAMEICSPLVARSARGA